MGAAHFGVYHLNCLSHFGGAVQLNGKTLHTLKQGKAFEVTNVQSDRIEFVPVSGNGTQRWIGREWIEKVVDMNLDESDLTPSRLSLEFPNDQNLSYMAAIVHTVTKA